jgi:hypothetical protein
MLLTLLKNTSKSDFEKFYAANKYIYDFKSIGTVLQQLVDDLYEPAFKKSPYANLKNLEEILNETVKLAKW